MLVLAERIKKKYFRSEKNQKIDKVSYYWLKNLENNKILAKRFQSAELFAL